MSSFCERDRRDGHRVIGRRRDYCRFRRGPQAADFPFLIIRFAPTHHQTRPLVVVTSESDKIFSMMY